MIRTVIGVALVLGLSLPSSKAFAEYQTAPVAKAGVVEGRVLLANAEPQIKRFRVFKDRGVCGAGSRDVPLVRANGMALLDTVVYLDDITRGKPFSAAAKKVTINQKACSFKPAMSVMASGGVLETVNSDPVLHNVHVYDVLGGDRRTVMTVSQPEKGDIAAKRLTLDRGHVLKIECDAHDFMHAWTFVAQNPYYAVVDREGRFRIDRVPPGNYTVRAWHRTLGIRAVDVTVPADGTVTLDLAY
ncbi:MAG: carboxypeptidase regulatory-like domain-containing protein [Alphaproteobacteria bacterium]|jgi:plastocyanin|nr:carboxypeptidase regulatory-like domain-containing protein [Alphaproteobacteria bacterium]